MPNSARKFLEKFERSHLSPQLQDKISALETLRFIENKENVILIGNPGVGMSHLAIGLGIKACLEGKKLLFASVPNFIIEIKEAMSHNKLSS